MATHTIPLGELFIHALSITAGFAWGGALQSIMRSLYPIGVVPSAGESTIYAIIVTLLIISLVVMVNYVSNSISYQSKPQLHVSPVDARSDRSVQITWK
jgi:hypothetical protein